MATIADVVVGVRQKLRDFPKMFQTDITGSGLEQIFELPVVMVRATDLVVNVYDTSAATPTTTALTAGTDYTLDAHHGMIMFTNNRRLQTTETLNVFGWHSEWLLDPDVEAEAGWFTQSLDESQGDDNFFAGFTTDDPRFELTVRGVLVACLWTLLIEASLDIDVRNPEGVDIPVSQRFSQLQHLVTVWTERYDELAQKLNIGLDRIQMLTLRRISLSTGRLVPVYVEQEFDDRATPQRLYPVIDSDQMLSNRPPPDTD